MAMILLCCHNNGNPADLSIVYWIQHNIRNIKYQKKDRWALLKQGGTGNDLSCIFLPGVYAIALGIQFLIGGSHICAYKRGLGQFNGKKGREKERK